MDYFDDVKGHYTLHTFSMEGQKTLGLNLKYLRLCSEDEQRSYRLGLGQHEGESLMTSF